MKYERRPRNHVSLLSLARIAVLICAGAAPIGSFAGSTPSIVLWDTGTPLADAGEAPNRAEWKAVPTELFTFEANPGKAASDPGYWGREYAFKGSAVVENQSLLAVFTPTRGSVTIRAKQGGGTSPAESGRLIAEVVPLAAPKAAPASISRVAIIRNAGDEVAIEVTYAGSAAGDEAESAQFSFGRNEIVEIKPAGKLKGLRLLSQMQYGILPSFIGDDLIYDPAAYPTANAITLPSENLFAGLQPGGDRMLIVTWPKGQQVQLGMGGAEDKRRIESLDILGGGQSFYLASLSAPGIWHREELKAGFLEKDVPLTWKAPFPAKWKTQLTENGIKTAYAFRQAKGTMWRGVAGSYDFPAWFDGDTAFLRLGKKVPPKGDALIYFLEARETPATITTPVDILKATLGRPLADAILDPAGRTLRTHHRRGGESVHRACTCGYTEAIEAVFAAGEETAKKQFIADSIDGMIYFIKCHLERIAQYRRFADDLTKDLRARSQAAPGLKPYFDNLEQIVQQIPEECEVQKENMQGLDHAAVLAKQTMALTNKVDPANVKAYAALLKAWRAMGGAQDYVVAKCHTITRHVFQEAGYGCAELPQAASAAEDIRARCRQALRHADGYEIWADY